MNGKDHTSGSDTCFLGKKKNHQYLFVFKQFNFPKGGVKNVQLLTLGQCNTAAFL